MVTEQIKPAHGFISNPKAGRGIAYGALIVALIGLLIPTVPALNNGPAYVKQVLALPPGSPLDPIGFAYTLIVIGTMILVLWHAIVSAGWKRAILALFSLMAVGFLAEGLGVNYGLVFGPYHYADFMPARIWGVPITVPISWLLNMYPAFYLALFLLPSELMVQPKTFARRAIAILLISSVGAMICTLWDLMADPIFVPFGGWVWHIPGDYAPYAEGGIPFVNFVGWIGSGIVGNTVVQLILRSTPKELHVRSRYLDIYSPLAMYFVPFAFGIMVELLYMHHNDVILVGCMGMGNILLMVLTKIYLIKNGYREHQLALDISEESSAKLRAEYTRDK